jgi:hypothetical protein
MKSPILSITIIIRIIKVFTSWQIEEIANNVGFTKRKRGVAAGTFFRVFTIES